MKFGSFGGAKSAGEGSVGDSLGYAKYIDYMLFAEQVATLDLVSNGRFDFGVGKCYRQPEFSGFCIPIEEATERFDETMAFLRKAWAANDRFSHHGTRWHFDNIIIEPRPVQQPHPP